MLPTPRRVEEQYFPCYFTEKSNLPLLDVEAKKLKMEDVEILSKDKRKLLCMMKSMLDQPLRMWAIEAVIVSRLLSSTCYYIPLYR